MKLYNAKLWELWRKEDKSRVSMGNREKGGSFKRRLAALLCSAAFFLVSVAGCSIRETGEQEEENSFRIVTSFYPMYIMTINITNGIDSVQVDNMAGQQTGCLHDYQLQSRDMQNLQKADAFVINGAGMESFMDKVFQQLPDLPVITASEGIPLLCAEEGHSHDEEEEHDHAEEEMNPHVWVSITNAAAEVRTIARGLAEADPEHAQEYLENAEIYRAKLFSLRDEMHRALDGVSDKRIITFHEAFPYFAEEFDLEIVKVINREPDSQPSAKELADTIRLIRETDVKAVFAEPQYSESAANIVAAESGANMYFLDPATTGENDPDAYLRAMEQNLETLKLALVQGG